MTGKLGSQDVDGQDDALAEAGSGGITLHHLFVTEYLGPANLEDTTDIQRDVCGKHQVAKNVTDSDGLSAGVHPPRRDHRRQTLGEIAKHLERRRPRTDNDGCTQFDRGHT